MWCSEAVVAGERRTNFRRKKGHASLKILRDPLIIIVAR